MVVSCTMIGCAGSPGDSSLPDATPRNNNVPIGGQTSGDLLFEGLIIQTNSDRGVIAWVRVCNDIREPIPDAKVTVNGRPYTFIEPRHMLTFNETCAHYEGKAGYEPDRNYRLRIVTQDNRRAEGNVHAPLTQNLIEPNLPDQATVARNENFVLNWIYEGDPPPQVLIAIIDQTGRRLYAALLDGLTTRFEIPAEDMLSIPPGEHELWIVAINGVQINQAFIDPVLGVGSGLWVGIGIVRRLFFI